MTAVEWTGLATLVATCGGMMLGMWRIVASQNTAAKLLLAENKKNSVPPTNHGPCNDAVNKLTEAMHAEITEQQAFRRSFDTWLAYEKGRRDELRATGDHPSAGD